MLVILSPFNPETEISTVVADEQLQSSNSPPVPVLLALHTVTGMVYSTGRDIWFVLWIAGAINTLVSTASVSPGM
jgi:hypothetical protein